MRIFDCSNMKYRFVQMKKSCAEKIVRWHYCFPYEFYNIENSRRKECIDSYLDPDNHYFSIENEMSELLGYCGFGPDAQVPGGDYSLDACDVGLGLIPYLTGRRKGKEFFQSILDFGINRYSPNSFRLTVAKFNSRAIHLYMKFGFMKISEFENNFKDTNFIIMTRTLNIYPTLSSLK